MGHRQKVAALAFHMLHRHGMAPLAASKDIAAFVKFHKTATSIPGVHGFVHALEKFPVVAQLFKKMQSMSLDGLRNVHSYDHSWSVDEGHGKGCSHDSSENCKLQASFSRNAHKLMGGYGFKTSTKDILHADWDKYTNGLWYGTLSAKKEVEGRL